jgi:hypothetical protein
MGELIGAFLQLFVENAAKEAPLCVTSAFPATHVEATLGISNGRRHMKEFPPYTILS